MKPLTIQMSGYIAHSPHEPVSLVNCCSALLSIKVLNFPCFGMVLQIKNQDVPGISFKTHPNINKELLSCQQIVGAKDPNRPFPCGQNETPLVKWRIQELNESSLPLAGILQLFALSSF